MTRSHYEVEDPTTLLLSWGSHSDESFHYFTNEEARNIRKALMIWYRKNRRKLPWRGDPPPFDGSTAGYSANNNQKKKVKIDKKSTITSYFKSKNKESKDSKEDHKNQKNVVTPDPNAKIDDINPTPISAYGVWVSEIMLQQTRVEAVIPYYIRWMKSFPTVKSLANASEEEVNAHWAGLGFYRRARYLHKGAKQVIELHNGSLPITAKELSTISGIGPYTAGAIASIAYNENVPVVDGNVCRVLARLKGIANHIKAPVLKDDIGWKLARQIIDAGDPNNINDYGSAGEVNQALMELGATFCSPSGSGMDEDDPLKNFYLSTKISKCIADIMKLDVEKKKQNTAFHSLLDILEKSAIIRESKSAKGEKCKLCDQDGIDYVFGQIIKDLEDNISDINEYEIGSLGHNAIPIPPPKKKKREEVFAVAVLCDSSAKVKRKRKQSVRQGDGERWLLIQRPAKGLLAGQWEFPSVCVWSSSDDQKKSKARNGAKGKSTKAPSKGSDDVPFIESRIRQKSLDKFLETKVLLPSSVEEDTNDLIKSFSTCPRIVVGDEALEHIFSHIRHTMWVEYTSIKYPPSLPSSWVVSLSLDSENNEERAVRWMSEEDMKNVGITSGVTKVLNAVKQQRENPRLKKKKVM